MTAEDVVARLGLESLDREGGWFRRIHTGELNESGRSVSTTIYALFTREQFSALHRLDALEQFFHLGGDAFDVFRIGANGVCGRQMLGSDLGKGEVPHIVFEAGCWFGGAPVEEGKCGWTLMSCVVTPGFEWDGFEIGDQDKLVADYPDSSEEICRLTRLKSD